MPKPLPKSIALLQKLRSSSREQLWSAEAAVEEAYFAEPVFGVDKVARSISPK
ncbi:hypothetical protein [Tannerella forsythia]|uniref:hypothetical protein n=1 Tax=Tannerella forsythia TaxID=28112 RepID=UPI001639FC9B|nr:hypothetical protein [Tannerella forsythia]